MKVGSETFEGVSNPIHTRMAFPFSCTHVKVSEGGFRGGEDVFRSLKEDNFEHLLRSYSLGAFARTQPHPHTPNIVIVVQIKSC